MLWSETTSKALARKKKRQAKNDAEMRVLKVSGILDERSKHNSEVCCDTLFLLLLLLLQQLLQLPLSLQAAASLSTFCRANSWLKCFPTRETKLAPFTLLFFFPFFLLLWEGPLLKNNFLTSDAGNCILVLGYYWIQLYLCSIWKAIPRISTTSASLSVIQPREIALSAL